MDILLILKVVVVVIVFFGASIFFHEWGHYWVARRRGMKVEAFAIGFGPKIFGWTKDGIEYSIRAIPAGGFVRLPQMITSEALEGESKEPVPPASPMDKILTALAGPIMNVIFAFVIGTVIYFTGLPLLVNPSVVGYVPPGSEEEKLGIKPGDMIVAVNGNPVTSWQQILMETAFAQTNVLPVAVAHEAPKDTWTTNIYQLTTHSTKLAGGLKLLNLGSRDHPVVGAVEAGNVAEKAGVKSKDKIVMFGGIRIVSQEQLIELVDKNGPNPAEIVVERDSQQMTFTLTPRYDEANKRHRIGIGFAGSYYQLQRPGPTPWAQIDDVLGQTFRTLNALFHSKQTGVGIKDLSGPPGILAMLASRVATDYRLALSFLVLLNINLAVLNMLPIPVLDGGHITMAIVEKVRGRPLSGRFIEYTTTAFAVMLLTLMAYISYNDIKRYPLFKAMFQTETRIEEPGAAPATNPAPAPEPKPAK